ncbi:MAG: hypothetical protein NTU83_09650 [Candidatus Hydrogenedentes bacterium]|nr:hypothetical protein [Candidatus Hydrogenedentota bacterium]
MDVLKDLYYPNQSLCHVVIGLLVFGGLGRIAFWRNEDGLRVGGLLASGLALLLTIAIIIWADENGRKISEYGHFAAGLITMAIFILGYRAFTKSREL